MLWSDFSNFCRRSQQSAISYFNLHVEVPHYVVFSSPLLPHPSQAKISSSALNYQTTSCVNMSDQVSHLCKITGKIIVLCFLIFLCFVSKLEDKGFCTLWQQAFPDFSLLSISTWIKFWFIGIVPKYLKFSMLSKDLTSGLCCDFVLHSDLETRPFT